MILEPIMKVCVIVPDEYMGDVIGDVTSRRGTILGHDTAQRRHSRSTAYVPLSEMFGYATDLRSADAGPRSVSPWSRAIISSCPRHLTGSRHRQSGKRACN